jgi:hypothetical protein
MEDIDGLMDDMEIKKLYQFKVNLNRETTMSSLCQNGDKNHTT